MAELIFGKYEVQQRLAVGGMGEVFLARQVGIPGFERPVILKSLLPELAVQKNFIDQFLDEARVAATLNHPNVVSIYEVGLWNGAYYMAMEFIQGMNLAQLVRHAQEAQLRVPPTVVAHVIRDAALGLDHAHYATDVQGKPLRIVHRDISPQNVMVREDGVTKVVDFGIAKAANRASRTRTGTVKGKLAYMAPEQLLGGPVDGKSDQFSLGVVAWELCAHRRMFSADDELSLMKLVANGPIPQLSEEKPGTPDELCAVIHRMVQRDPARRFERLADVARDLSQFLTHSSSPTRQSPVAEYLERLLVALPAIERPHLTPSPRENFVLDLRATPGSEAPTRMMGPGTPPAPLLLPGRTKRKIGALVGAAALAAVAVLALWFALQTAAPPPVLAPPAPVALRPVPAPTGPDAPPSGASEAAASGLVLATQPSGAAVKFDGRRAGESPLRLDGLEAGRHYVVVERRGFKRVEQQVQLEPGKVLELTITLEASSRPVPAPGPGPLIPRTVEAAPGYLSLDTEPWTKVSAEGEPFGSTPLFKRKLAAGVHTVRLVNEGAGIDVTRQVEISPGEVTSLRIKLGPP